MWVGGLIDFVKEGRNLVTRGLRCMIRMVGMLRTNKKEFYIAVSKFLELHHDQRHAPRFEQHTCRPFRHASWGITVK